MKINIDEILNLPESSILDFKFDIYHNDEHNHKILKDIISFSNTVRTKTARILFGVEENNNGECNVVGITKSLDDANIQNLAADKLFPFPKFLYYEVEYNSLKVGILEFPIVKYSYPITCKYDLKGINKNRVYFRMGSRNTEADVMTTIKINNWLMSLPSSEESNNFLSQSLLLISNTNRRLSEVLVEILPKAKQLGYDSITELVKTNLTTINHEDLKNHEYRYQSIYIALNDLRFEYGTGVNDQMFKSELEKDNAVVKHRVPFNQSVVEIEKHYSEFLSRKTLFACLEQPGNVYFKNVHNNVKLFLFKDNFENLLQSIRQRIIDEILKTE